MNLLVAAFLAISLPVCCSESPFDPPDSKKINMLPRRSASNLRA